MEDDDPDLRPARIFQNGAEEERVRLKEIDVGIADPGVDLERYMASHTRAYSGYRPGATALLIVPSVTIVAKA